MCALTRLLATLPFIALILTSCAMGSALNVGEPVIPFTALDVSGTPISLDDFKARKNVVLVFYIGHT